MENNHPLNPLIRSRAARVQLEESQTLLPCVRATPDLCGSRKVASLEAREVSPMSAEGVGRLDAATASPVWAAPEAASPTWVRRVLSNELGPPKVHAPWGEVNVLTAALFWSEVWMSRPVAFRLRCAHPAILLEQNAGPVVQRGPLIAGPHLAAERRRFSVATTPQADQPAYRRRSVTHRQLHGATGTIDL
ncbi:hypothetical protein SAMN05216338_100947 [Bradyrhizobium sp. Rc2d]|nr:hypothetical protein SAMN05216338_100947 [Bradyrhizobium sp. Rc2d]